MKSITLASVTKEMQKHGYKIFETGNYNLNIVGLRTLPGIPNTFDDTLCIFYKVNGEWNFHSYAMTTDPGFYWLKYPMRVDGTAVLMPGQYRSCWKIGLHQGKYKALVQNGSPFKVWRDKDRDGYVDYSGPVYTDVQGLNFHHAGTDSQVVEKWSAGCQVLKRLPAWNEAISLTDRQVQSGMGETFSYTLLEWS